MSFLGGLSGLEILGVVGDVISLVPTIQEFLAPKPSTNQKTSVRVALGHSLDHSDGLGGNVPGVSLWDIGGKAIGFAPGKKDVLKPGEFVDIEIEPREEVGNIQAQYISVANGGIDAICVAGLAITFPDGAQSGFSTDVAILCGAPWANSDTPLLGQPADGVAPAAKCIWIDRDGSNDLPYQGFGLHLPSFAKTNKNLGQSYSDDNRLMCSAPRLHMYPKLISEDPILVFPKPPEFKSKADTNDTNLIGTDKDPNVIIDNPGKLAEAFEKKDALDTVFDPITPNFIRRRKANSTAIDNSKQPSRPPMAERVVVSPNTFNSARELCESETSFGPSFVSLPEGLFCDMIDKSLFYVCDKQAGEQATSCCYDTGDDSFIACEKGDTRPSTTKQKRALRRSGKFKARKESDTQVSASTRSGKKFDNVQKW